MKSIVILTAILFSFLGYAQVSGKIKVDGRKMISQSDFTVKGKVTGTASYKIAVDVNGNISSATIVKDRTTVKSTPHLIKGSRFVKALKFEKCTYCPNFHSGIVRVSFIKE